MVRFQRFCGQPPRHYRQVLLTCLLLLALVLPNAALAVEPPARMRVQQSATSQLQVDSDFLEFFALENGQSPEPQSFTFSSGDGSSVSWQAFVETDDGGQWLSLSTESGTVADTPMLVEVTVDSTGLSAGWYAATLFILDVDALEEWQIGVFLEIASDNAPILSIEPAFLSFEVASGGGNPPAQSFTIANTGSVPFHWTALADAAWLTVTPTAGEATASPTPVAVSVDTTGLISGFHDATIELFDETTGYYAEVIVELLITADVALTVQPASLSFTLTQGVVTTTTQTLAVTGAGNDALEWFAMNQQDWLVLFYDEEDDSKLYVDLDSAQLAAGVYTDTITVFSNGGSTEIPVSLTLQSPAEANESTPAPNLAATLALEPANPTPGQPVVIVATITNNGNASTNQGFYVDLAINPARTPAAGATDWSSFESNLSPVQGIEWGVAPLDPGQSVTLRSDTTNPAAIAPDPSYTNWSGQFATGTKDLYLLVDSYDGNGSPNGVILESNESDNLIRLTLGDATPPPAVLPAAVTLTGLEVTQAIQDLNNSVPLIKDKPTFVRAHVRSAEGAVAGVTARLRGTRNGQELPDSPLSPINDGGRIDVRAEPNRATLNDSFLFDLPAAWRNGQVTLTFEGVSQQIGCAEVASTPNDCQATVAFESVPALPVTFIRASWQDGNDQSYTTSDEDFAKVVREVEALLPIPNLDWTVVTETLSFPSYPSPGDMLAKATAIWNKAGQPRRHYYALATNWQCIPGQTCGSGVAYRPGPTGAGYTTLHTTAHELGHNLGRQHVNSNGTEANPDPNYPYPGGQLSDATTGNNAFYGFNIFTKEVLPATYHDLLGYRNPDWVSDYQYKAMKAAVTNGAGLPQPPAPETIAAGAAAVPVLWIAGELNAAAGQGTLTTIFDSEGTPSSGGATGAYAVQLLDNNNQIVTNYAFDALETSEEEEKQPFVIFLPKPANVAKVVLLHGNQRLVERLASATAPVVTVTSPNGGETITGGATITWNATDADGNPLVSLVEYSTDNGATWSILAAGISGNSLTVDATALRGSTQALIRVSSSDGLRTGSDQSNAVFTVANKSPEVIITRVNGQRFVGNQVILLQGAGLDPEDGKLTGASLSWSSTRNGKLGTGESLMLSADKLKEGKHTLTLVARDKAGLTTSASITIEVLRQAGNLPAEVGLYPNAIGAAVTTGATQTTAATVAVANDGDGLLAWTATANQPWLKLSAANGVAPAELTITIDPAGLAAGEYSGAVTVTDTRSGRAKTVAATLLVNQTTFALTTNVVGQGTVAATPQGPYTAGQQATLTATPAQGWVFSGWSGAASGATNPLTVTMDGNKSITATFTQQSAPANPLYLPLISR